MSETASVPGWRERARREPAARPDDVGRHNLALVGPDQARRFVDLFHRASFVRAMKCGLEKRGLP